METSRAASLARSAMNDHGLGHWTFQFDRAVRRFGACNHAKTRIKLSEKLVRLNDEAAVLDVILHEIAHALVGPGHGHDGVWKAKAREIGANPERCYDDAAVVTPVAPYLLVCANCGPFSVRHRRRSGTYTHNRCGGGAVTFRENVEGWTKERARVDAYAESVPRPALDADARARVEARAAERAARVAKRLGA